MNGTASDHLILMPPEAVHKGFNALGRCAVDERGADPAVPVASVESEQPSSLMPALWVDQDERHKHVFDREGQSLGVGG